MTFFSIIALLLLSSNAHAGCQNSHPQKQVVKRAQAETSGIKSWQLVTIKPAECKVIKTKKMMTISCPIIPKPLIPSNAAQLLLATKPANADIYINDIHIGQTNDRGLLVVNLRTTEAKLAANIVARRADHNEYQQTVTLKHGEPLVLTIELIPKPLVEE